MPLREKVHAPAAHVPGRRALRRRPRGRRAHARAVRRRRHRALHPPRRRRGALPRLRRGGVPRPGPRRRLPRGEGEIVQVGQHLAGDALRGAQGDRARAATSPTAPPTCWPSRWWSAARSGTCVVPREKQRAARRGGRAGRGAAWARRSIITAAVVGAEVTRAQSPAVPYTPEEIARAAVDAGRAGAAAVHLHARWPDGRPSQEARALPRDRRPDPRRGEPASSIQCSTGGAVGMSVDERLGSLVDGAEMGTLNLGTMNFGDEVFPNTRPGHREGRGAAARAAARARSARSTTPACSTRCAGCSRRATSPRPYHVQFVLGRAGRHGRERAEPPLPASRGCPSRPTGRVAGVGRPSSPWRSSRSRSAATSASASRTTCSSRRASSRGARTSSSRSPSSSPRAQGASSRRPTRRGALLGIG